jgi:hypothetical protein
LSCCTSTRSGTRARTAIALGRHRALVAVVGAAAATVLVVVAAAVVADDVLRRRRCDGFTSLRGDDAHDDGAHAPRLGLLLGLVGDRERCDGVCGHCRDLAVVVVVAARRRAERLVPLRPTRRLRRGAMLRGKMWRKSSGR